MVRFVGLLTLLALSSITLGNPSLHRRISQCSGIPGGIFYNGTALSDTEETAIIRHVQQTIVLSGVFYYNRHGGAPCDPKFALGLTTSESAPSNVLDDGWVNSLSIGGTQSNEIVLRNSLTAGRYNVFLAQYDPATGEILPGGQAKAKICYQDTFSESQPCST